MTVKVDCRKAVNWQLATALVDLYFHELHMHINLYHCAEKRDAFRGNLEKKNSIFKDIVPNRREGG